jgi:hypothetical protein
MVRAADHREVAGIASPKWQANFGRFTKPRLAVGAVAVLADEILSVARMCSREVQSGNIDTSKVFTACLQSELL